MNIYRNIVESETAPNIHDLWLKADGIYKFGNNGWEPISKIESKKQEDSFKYLMSLCTDRAKELREEAATTQYPTACIVNLMQFEGSIDAEHQVDMKNVQISSFSNPGGSITNLGAINAERSYTLSTLGSFFISTRGEETTTTCFVSTAIFAPYEGLKMSFTDISHIPLKKDYDIIPITINASGMYVDCYGFSGSSADSPLEVSLDLRLINEDLINTQIPIVNIVTVKKDE